MKISDLLSLYPASHDTILIDGSPDIDTNDASIKGLSRVIASCEKIGNDCIQRLTIYTNGYFKCNFFDKIVFSKIVMVNDNLTTIKI